jgi:dienelactone hydrolase
MKMETLGPLTLAACLLTGPFVVPAEAGSAPATEKGTVRFRTVGSQDTIPGRYRLSAHTFPFDLVQTDDLPLSGLEIYHLTFPSPVTTTCKENNTVHAEYYRPKGKGPFPGVIVLDITAGHQQLSRMIATHLAQNRIAGLFVQMAYYGPRRPPGSRLRLLSPDVRHTLAAVRQTVLDIRRATAWLASRPEIDGGRLGISGTSLGSFVAALAAEMEPHLSRVAVLLGGGGFVDAYYDDPRGKNVRQIWEALGGTKEKAAKLIAPVDPITCAANLKDRRVLLLAARRDDIVPPRMAKALWKASGRQKIVWYDCTHYGAVAYLAPALGELVKHFGAK